MLDGNAKQYSQLRYCVTGEMVSEFHEVITPRFNGIERLYGKGSLEALSRAHVLVVGVGGVGSWAAEALARTGVGHLTLVDLDDVCVSNCNRQLHALDGEIGRQKVDVMRERILRINPVCKIRAVSDFYTPKTESNIFQGGLGAVDFVVDAIDSLSNKAHLLASCMRRLVPAVTVGGAGGRSDPTQIQTKLLNQSGYDGLLRMVRKKLRKHHQDIAELATMCIPAVHSREQPRLHQDIDQPCQLETTSNQSPRINCQTGYGTASFVTAVFGMVAASIVANHLADPLWCRDKYFDKVKS